MALKRQSPNSEAAALLSLPEEDGMAETEKERWDRAAGDYQRVYSLGLNEYNASILRFWHEKGMLFPGCRVIDIGCGVGKYGTYLAELGYDVTLIDISDKMLSHASENMAKYSTPWTVYCCDFNEVSGKEPVFRDGFDFAISTMSPAIHDATTVRKMSTMTHGWCFLARFQSWEQPFRDTLMRNMGIEPRRVFENLTGDVVSIIRSVSEAGYLPLVSVVDYAWSDRRTPEQMADYIRRNYFTEEAAAEQLQAKALRTAESMAEEDGCVNDNVNTKVAWIYWRTEE